MDKQGHRLKVYNEVLSCLLAIASRSATRCSPASAPRRPAAPTLLGGARRHITLTSYGRPDLLKVALNLFGFKPIRDSCWPNIIPSLHLILLGF